jgi:CheY-like chemotaxis protein
MANILVVDDDTLTLDLFTIVLQRHGYFFSVAKDGAEALKLCESQKFDLIITDIFMPNMDGFELIVDLVGKNSKVPVIAMSGGGYWAVQKVLPDALILGAQIALAKPFSKEQLFDAIDAALNFCNLTRKTIS